MTMRLKDLAGALALAATLCLSALPAAAQAVGDRVSGVLTLADRQAPLPPGEWTVVALRAARVMERPGPVPLDPLEYGPVRNVVLARIAGGRVDALVEVNVNGMPFNDGWGSASACKREDLYATVTHYKSGWDVSCMYVAPVAIEGAARSRSLWQAVSAHAAGSQASLSEFWIGVGYRVSSRHDVLDVRYLFDPVGLGGSTADPALWNPQEIASRAEQLAVVKDVAAWGGGLQEHIEAGARGKLAQTAFPAPRAPEIRAAADPAAQSREKRLAQLAALHAEGAIDQAEHDRQAAAIAAEEQAATATSWTYSEVAAYKALTYRVIVTTINVGIDYVFIGRPFAAGVLVILQVVVNTTKFYFHEMLWQQIFNISPIQRDAPPVVDFEYVSTVPLFASGA